MKPSGYLFLPLSGLVVLTMLYSRVFCMSPCQTPTAVYHTHLSDFSALSILPGSQKMPRKKTFLKWKFYILGLEPKLINFVNYHKTK